MPRPGAARLATVRWMSAIARRRVRPHVVLKPAMPGPARASQCCGRARRGGRRAAPGTHRPASGSHRSASGNHRLASGCRLPVSGPTVSGSAVSGLAVSGPGRRAALRPAPQPQGTRGATSPCAVLVTAVLLTADRDNQGACAPRNVAPVARLAHQREPARLACQPPAEPVRRAAGTGFGRPGQRGLRDLPARHQRGWHRSAGRRQAQAVRSVAGQPPGAWTAPEPARLRRCTGSSRNRHRLAHRIPTYRHRATCPGPDVRVAAGLW